MRRVTIGSLRRRLVIETPVRNDDEGGGTTVTWSPIGIAWAQVESVTGREQVHHDAVNSTVSHLVTIRYRGDVAPAMRFRDGNRLFEIRAVLEPDGRRRTMSCLCAEERL